MLESLVTVRRRCVRCLVSSLVIKWITTCTSKKDGCRTVPVGNLFTALYTVSQYSKSECQILTLLVIAIIKNIYRFFNVPDYFLTAATTVN